MIFLSDEEIAFLTKRKAWRSQIMALKNLCLEHKVRPDGSPVVLREHVYKVMGGDIKRDAPPKKVEPNFGAITSH